MGQSVDAMEIDNLRERNLGVPTLEPVVVMIGSVTVSLADWRMMSLVLSKHVAAASRSLVSKCPDEVGCRTESLVPSAGRSTREKSGKKMVS